jgi:hypothetical protein
VSGWRGEVRGQPSCCCRYLLSCHVGGGGAELGISAGGSRTDRRAQHGAHRKKAGGLEGVAFVFGVG